MMRRLPPETYGRDFFLSDSLEGYREYQEGTLSSLRTIHLEMLKVHSGVSVLEVGHGRGELLLHCALSGATIAGVDYSPEAHAIARETLAEFPDADLRLADCKSLPFDSGSFDRVFSGDVIEHLCFDDAVEMLKEMYRVTKPGGFMLAHTTPNTIFTKFVYPWAKHILRRIDQDGIAGLDQQLEVMKRLHVDEYNLFTLRRACINAGLSQSMVWIDKDLMRRGTHRLIRRFAENGFARFVASLGKYPIVRFFLGNDLYLRCDK